jgi:DMSO/TMAO reductase YedYZ molybdopterin-dependent catalytic subunit
MRLIVPHLYLWKSAKWLRRIDFLTADKAGFWELNGYHMRGDPWLEQRYTDD